MKSEQFAYYRNIPPGRRSPAHAGRRRVRAVGALVLLCFLATSQGVLPTTGWLSDTLDSAVGERYPCKGGRCGCTSARECWSVCLCQTLEQKLAWAEANGVQPPAFVLARLETRPQPRQSGPCCSTTEPAPSTDACCCGPEPQDTQPQTCCVETMQIEPTQTCCATRDAEPPAPVTTLTALGCKGVELLGVAAVLPVLLGDRFVLPEDAWCVDMCFGWTDEHSWRSRVLGCEPPPPRA